MAPSRQFAILEIVSGGILAVAVLGALFWNNSSYSNSYVRLWSTPIHLAPMPSYFFSNVAELTNNGLMTLFFLAVGLEIGQERGVGILRSPRTALLPVAAALGGMAGASLTYFFVVSMTSSRKLLLAGWGIPMATDVAFVLVALALLGRRVPKELRMFCIALAVADDVASVVVLAGVGSVQIRPLWLTSALSLVLLLSILKWRGPLSRTMNSQWWPYLIATFLEWYLLAKSGVEPPLAGVFIGILVPVVPLVPTSRMFLKDSDARAEVGNLHLEKSSSERLERIIHPISAFVVLPLFILANTGVHFTLALWKDNGTQTMFSAITMARVFGKGLGIILVVLLLVRLGASRLPAGVGWIQLIGAAILCGMGFTVPMLFARVVLKGHPLLISGAQLGLLAGTIITFISGTMVLLLCRPHRRLH